MGHSPTHSTVSSEPIHEEPQDRATTAVEPGAAEPLPRRRRQFLVDRRSQLHSVALVGMLTLGLLVPVNLSLHMVRSWTTAEIVTEAPKMARVLDERGRVERRRALIGSGIVLLAAMTMTVLRTRKVTGAAYRLCRGIAGLRDGKYGLSMALRRGDRLRNVEQELNDLSRILLERSDGIAAELEDVAAAADRVGSPVEASEIGERLRQMAAQERLNRLS